MEMVKLMVTCVTGDLTEEHLKSIEHSNNPTDKISQRNINI